MALFDCTCEATSGHARALTYETAHGTFHTPMFMPVGTSATVKEARGNASRFPATAGGAAITLHSMAGLLLGFTACAVRFIAYAGSFTLYSFTKRSAISGTPAASKVEIFGMPVATSKPMTSYQASSIFS